MAAAQGQKGNKVKLLTFNDGISYVNFIWCKVCSTNSNAMLNHHKCKGGVTNSVKTFINGMNGVTKHFVDCQLFTPSEC